MSWEIKSILKGAPPPVFPKMTYQEFLTAIPDDIHAEWVNGEVVLMTPISRVHQDLGRFLLNLTSYFVEAHQLGSVQYEPFQMKTSPKLPGRSPDILFVASEHLDRLKENHLDGPADLVVEIISPDSRARDRKEKFREYERGGVCEYWVLDPDLRKADFYTRGKDGLYHPLPIGEDNVLHSKVLNGFWLKLDWLWTEGRPSLIQVLKEWKLI